MPLSLTEGLGFIPKTTELIIKAVEKVNEVKALPTKTAKSVGATLGVVPNSLIDDVLGLVDDIVAAAAS